MKAFIISLLLCLALGVQAQSADTHLAFDRSVEIDGTADNFRDQLLKQGFTLYTQNPTALVMEGKWRNDVPVTLVVPVNEETGQIYTVRMLVDKSISQSWTVLKDEFNDTKRTLTAIYGEPSNALETFSKPYEGLDSMGKELEALHADHCHYLALWRTPQGNIMLSLQPTGTSTKYGMVVVQYEDAANFEKYGPKVSLRDELLKHSN